MNTLGWADNNGLELFTLGWIDLDEIIDGLADGSIVVHDVLHRGRWLIVEARSRRLDVGYRPDQIIADGRERWIIIEDEARRLIVEGAEDNIVVERRDECVVLRSRDITDTTDVIVESRDRLIIARVKDRIIKGD